MSAEAQAPAGWTWSRFEAVATECGGWLWGTVQGAFNEKATLSQIVVDAVVGMIPLVGDATAVRDLIAVSIGLIDEPQKRDDVWEWVLLVVLIFALIPVVGGVIKGVGRIICKVAKEARSLDAAARAGHFGQAAKDIVAFLNRLGVGNAEKWLLQLNFAEHQGAILSKLDDFTYTVNGALTQIERKLGGLLGQSLLQRIEGLKNGMNQLAAKGREMVPKAIVELNHTLAEIQRYVRSGGETTSQVASHTVASGAKAVTYADELRLTEGMGAVRTARGGWQKNKASTKKPAEVAEVYRHEPGYPNLLSRIDEKSGSYVNITTFSGKIQNRTLKRGEQIFRVFGSDGVTHQVSIGKSFPGGNPKYPAAFWGLGPPPKDAKEWRETAAVLDEWNRDSFIAVGTVHDPSKVKACTGKIAEQTGSNIPGQYLPGGGTQAMIETPSDVITRLNAAGETVMSSGKPVSFVHDGISWEIRPTGWTDANGIHGYGLVTGNAAVQTSRLGARERASKDERNQGTR